MTDPHEWIAFRASLHEAEYWCNSRLKTCDIENSLRSPELKPAPLVYTGEMGTEEDTFINERIMQLNKRSFVVRELAKKRLKLISEEINMLVLPTGKLLLLEVDNSMRDGLAQANSNGFFDVDNFPPWDTWISYFIDNDELSRWRQNVTAGGLKVEFLVSWVPTELVELVNKAINCNAEKCLSWADDIEFRESPLIKRLVEEKIVGQQ